MRVPDTTAGHVLSGVAVGAAKEANVRLQEKATTECTTDEFRSQ